MKKLLLVDTNVISHTQTSNQSIKYGELFRELETNYLFVVTGFTKYELLRSSSKEYWGATTTFLSQNMKLVELSDSLMSFSARLHYLYTNHPDIKGREISDGDIINAAFAIT